jgi:hypothetical protein
VVASGVAAALISPAVAARSGFSAGVATLFAVATAVLSVIAVVVAFIAWVAIE